MSIKQQLKNIKSNKDKKVLLQNFTALSLLQIAGYIFPLITLPYLAKVIGVEKFGEIAFASIVISYINTIVYWGFNYTATRDIAKNRNNLDKVSEIFSNVTWARCLLMVISLFILLILILIIPKFRQSALLIIFTFGMIPGNVLYPEWLFQGLERMKYITILNLLSKIFFTIMVFVFIKHKSDYILQPLFTSLGYILSGIIAMYLIIIKWGIKIKKPSFDSIKITLKGSSDVFLNALMPNLYNSFSILLVGFWGGAVSNGLLDAGRKLESMCESLMTVLYRTFFPYLSRKIDGHGKYAKLCIGISFIAAIIMFIFAPFFIKTLYAPEFSKAVTVLRISSFAIIFSTLYYVYGFSYLVIKGYEQLSRKITMVVSIIGFCMAIPLVYFYDYIGAAIVYTVVTGILGFSMMYKVHIIKSLKK